MIKVGEYNDLIVEKFVDFGLYLLADGDSILLPKKYVPENIEVGDSIKVFIYTDSEDRLIATTLNPIAVVGDFAPLVVKDVNNYGAFMEWGLEKDLFVPFKEQSKRMQPGKKYVVKVLLDPRTNRVIGSTKLSFFFKKNEIELKTGEEVDLLIYDQTDLGYQAIINDKYSGMLYYNEVFKKVEVGSYLTGYVKNIRPDNKIDLTINKVGKDSVDDAREQVLEALKKNNNFLPLNDDSDPEQIKKQLQMSKKTFKKAIGGLYKEKLIEFDDNGIRLK
ncbi:MAG TPA: S1-like domain-containing RNA-binding protein [Cytophagales bacterium]|nr:S1-like domain-containing RNA-binding protein [Cytophagales bacterium]